MTTTRKILGDGGEHYALSKFSFADIPCTKMPDGWRDYDLIVEKDNKLIRVSVKTRSETDDWDDNSWFKFNDRGTYEWIVCIFKSRRSEIRAWIIPTSVALENVKAPKENSKQPSERRLPYRKLVELPLARYEDNWGLVEKP